MKSLIALAALAAGTPVAWAQNSSDAIVTPGVDKLKQDQAATPDPAAPPAAAPIIRPLPTIAPPVAVGPTRATLTPAPSPVQPTPAPSERTPARPAPQASDSPPPPTITPADQSLRDNGMMNVTPPAEAPPVAENGLEPEAPVAAEPATNTDWTPWMIGGGVILLALIAFLLRGRRRAPMVEEAVAEETLVQEAGPVADAPVTAAPPAASVRRSEEDRPNLVIGFIPQSARVTLVGAAVGYRLTIENKGPRAAEEVMLTGILTNADAQQQAVLANFFASASEMVGDVIGRIEPGQMLDLEGEMRIGHERIAPLEVQGRKLLIPVVALNLRYSWTRDQRIDKGVGRNGSAFIVGQESDPPREKMAPFRLDQGPRQYRTVGARLAQNPVSD